MLQACIPSKYYEEEHGKEKLRAKIFLSVYAMVESIRNGCGNVTDISTYDEKQFVRRNERRNCYSQKKNNPME